MSNTNIFPGTTNDTAESYLDKLLNPYIKGVNRDALIKALATGEQLNWDNAEKAFNQLFINSASGVYLTRKGADEGVEKPKNLGISDELFRKLILNVKNGKVTENSLLQILEIFYGIDLVRASARSLPEPFVGEIGDDLNLLFDNKYVVNIVLADEDIHDFDNITAMEMSVLITKACQTADIQAFAVPVFSPTAGTYSVSIYSPSLGLGSAVKITGGKCQNYLQFPTLLDSVQTNFSTPPTWTITFDAEEDTVRFTCTNSTIDLTQLFIGDYVNIYGAEFDPGNQGSFTVTNVNISYSGSDKIQFFEIENPNGSNETVLQTARESLLYFRPTSNTLQSSDSVIVSHGYEQLDIVLPATNISVNRTEKTAAYLQTPTTLDVESLIRYSGNGDIHVVFAGLGSGDLSVGDQVYLDNVYPNYELPTVTPATFPLTDYGDLSLRQDLDTTASFTATDGVLLAMYDGTALHSGGQRLVAGVASGYTEYTNYMFLSSTDITPDARQYSSTSDDGTSTFSADVVFSAGSVSDDGTPSGKAIFTGGFGSFGPDALTQCYSSYRVTPPGFASMSWNYYGNLAVAMYGHVQINQTASTDTVYTFGGVSTGSTQSEKTVQKSPITSGTFTTITDMLESRTGHTITSLGNDEYLIVGGRDIAGGQFLWTDSTDTGTITNKCEIYSIAGGGTTNYTGQMQYARFEHQTVKTDKLIIALGGVGLDPTNSTVSTPLKSTELFDEITGRWYPGPPMLVARHKFVALYMAEKNIIFVTGGEEYGATTTSEYLDLNTMKWHFSVAGGLGRYSTSQGVVLDDRLIIVAGGQVDVDNTVDADTMFVLSNETFGKNAINGIFTINDVTDDNNITLSSPSDSYFTSDVTGMVLTLFAASPGEFAGPFILNPYEGVSITSVNTTVTEIYYKDNQYASIKVTDASDFPDTEGWLVLAFGYENQFGPIKYFGRTSDNELLIDYKNIFDSDILIGDSVILLSQKEPFNPSHLEALDIGVFYLTDSSAGRLAAENVLKSAIAAGVNKNFDIIFPGDRGLANEGYPTENNYKLSGVVTVWGSNDPDADLANAEIGNE